MNHSNHQKFGLDAPDVLVIDDDESMREGCRQTLEAEGYNAAVAHDGMQGLEMVRRTKPKIVVLDLKMPGLSGAEVIEKLSELDPAIISIVITGYGTIDVAVDSIKKGAFDFLSKPFEPEQLLDAVKRALKTIDGKRVETGLHAQERKAPERADAILKGLEAMQASYALGIKKNDLLEQIAMLEQDYLGTGSATEKMKDILKDLHVADGIIAKHDFKKHELLQMLLDVQQQIRWVPRYVIRWMADRLNMPMAAIYSIVNFYDAFSLEPRGAHIVQMCTGTACHVRGAPELLTKVSSLLGILPGETDSQKVFSLETVHCMGCCALAPVVKIDDRYYGNPSIDELKEAFKVLKEVEELSCQK
jgi:NADH-quinone oxidoreductase subunit E